jgi:hypothetical protein
MPELPAASSPLRPAPAATSVKCGQPVPDLRSLPGFFRGSLLETAGPRLRWLWQGYLAAGNVTLLTSQWKSGKTTLVAVLLARLAQGGQLAGLGVQPGKAVVISEESPLLWHERDRKLHFGTHVNWLCRPFVRRPGPEEWDGLLEALVQLHATEGIDLVVIDPLANFLPGRSENVADSLMATLLSLQRLTRLGMSVWILHHPRKGEVRAGQAARGSGVLGAYVDILLEMRCYRQPSDPDRRRVIEGYSRHDATPRRLVIELTPDGTDYLSHGDFREDDLDQQQAVLLELLATAEEPLTRREIRRGWPDERRPDEATLWRWLERLVAEGRVVRQGGGRRGDPFRFGLANGGEAEV